MHHLDFEFGAARITSSPEALYDALNSAAAAAIAGNGQLQQ